MYDEKRTRRRFITGAGIAVAVGFAGCAAPSDSGPTRTTESEDASTTDQSTDDHSHSGSDNSLAGPKQSYTVTMKTTGDGSHFEPHVIWVEQGGTVTWDLDSGAHSTTAYAEANDKPQRIPADASGWDSGTLSEQGKTFEHTFETPGVYDYFCIPHEGSGMVGSVIVGEPESDGQPALQSPQESLPAETRKKLESLNATVTETLGDSQGTHSDSETHSETHSGTHSETTDGQQ